MTSSSFALINVFKQYQLFYLFCKNKYFSDMIQISQHRKQISWTVGKTWQRRNEALSNAETFRWNPVGN
jgi:hypothetical protein